MWKSFGSVRGPRKTDGEQWQPGTASVMAQYKKMILAPNGHAHKKRKRMQERGRRLNGGEGKRRARRLGNSFANQALVLRSISSCQWVPGVNKVISFNPALQLYITLSSREYAAFLCEQRREISIWLFAGMTHNTHTPKYISLRSWLYTGIKSLNDLLGLQFWHLKF